MDKEWKDSCLEGLFDDNLGLNQLFCWLNFWGKGRFFRLPVNATDIQLADIIGPVQNFTFVALVIVYILFFLFFSHMDFLFNRDW